MNWYLYYKQKAFASSCQWCRIERNAVKVIGQWIFYRCPGCDY